MEKGKNGYLSKSDLMCLRSKRERGTGSWHGEGLERTIKDL